MVKVKEKVRTDHHDDDHDTIAIVDHVVHNKRVVVNKLPMETHLLSRMRQLQLSRMQLLPLLLVPVMLPSR